MLLDKSQLNDPGIREKNSLDRRSRRSIAITAFIYYTENPLVVYQQQLNQPGLTVWGERGWWF